MGSRQRWFFAICAVGMSTVIGFGLLLGFDLYLHKKFDKIAGLNARGYRGPLIGHKKPGEVRVVVLGGSTALGYGVAPEESFPTQLEQMVNEERRKAGRPPIQVINIATNSEGAYAYKYNLRYFEFLDYDLALFYTGYNDLGQGHNTYVYRKTSPIFTLTGYMPIFPLILREKAMAIRQGGDLEAAYRQQKTMFRPNLAQRATAGTLEAAVEISHALEGQLGKLSKDPAAYGRPAPVPCADPWTFYCEQMYYAVQYAIDHGKKALVVDEPYLTDGHVGQVQALAGMIQEKFRGDPRVGYANLGPLLDVRDPAVAYDGMHLTAPANKRVAEALIEPVLKCTE